MLTSNQSCYVVIVSASGTEDGGSKPHQGKRIQLISGLKSIGIVLIDKKFSTR
jgi:hypothetical protein